MCVHKVHLLTTVWSYDKVCIQLHPQVGCTHSHIDASKGQLLTRDPPKFQVRLEVMSLSSFMFSILVDLSIIACGSIQGAKPLTRRLSCSSLCLFGSQETNEAICWNPNTKIKVAPLISFPLKSFALYINKHAYRHSTHLTSSPFPI